MEEEDDEEDVDEDVDDDVLAEAPRRSRRSACKGSPRRRRCSACISAQCVYECVTVQYSNGTLSTRVFGQRGKSSVAVRASIPAQVVSSRR
jgi:hypothetical protein